VGRVRGGGAWWWPVRHLGRAPEAGGVPRGRARRRVATGAPPLGAGADRRAHVLRGAGGKRRGGVGQVRVRRRGGEGGSGAAPARPGRLHRSGAGGRERSAALVRAPDAALRRGEGPGSGSRPDLLLGGPRVLGALVAPRVPLDLAGRA